MATHIMLVYILCLEWLKCPIPARGMWQQRFC